MKYYSNLWVFSDRTRRGEQGYMSLLLDAWQNRKLRARKIDLYNLAQQYQIFWARTSLFVPKFTTLDAADLIFLPMIKDHLCGRFQLVEFYH